MLHPSANCSFLDSCRVLDKGKGKIKTPAPRLCFCHAFFVVAFLRTDQSFPARESGFAKMSINPLWGGNEQSVQQ